MLIERSVTRSVLAVAMIAAACGTVRHSIGWAGDVRDQVVVLENGRIIAGRITPSPEGYWLERPAGRLLIEKSQVRCVAPDFRGAYRQLRERRGEADVEACVALAEWCWGLRLYEEARNEYRQALLVEPERADLQRRLARLDETLADLARQKNDPVAAAEPDAVAGLTRATVTQFTARVQPMLVNKCLKCHHPASGREFTIVPIRIGSPVHRSVAEQNVRSVLKQLDLDRPLDSALLKSMDVGHGGASNGASAGAATAEQRRTVELWIQDVARDRRTAPLNSTATQASFANVASRSGGAESSAGSPHDVKPIKPSAATESPASSTRKSTSTAEPSRSDANRIVDNNVMPAVLEEISPPAESPKSRSNPSARSWTRDDAGETKAPRRDAFDPQRFNDRSLIRPR